MTAGNAVRPRQRMRTLRIRSRVGKSFFKKMPTLLYQADYRLPNRVLKFFYSARY